MQRTASDKPVMSRPLARLALVAVCTSVGLLLAMASMKDAYALVAVVCGAALCVVGVTLQIDELLAASLLVVLIPPLGSIAIGGRSLVISPLDLVLLCWVPVAATSFKRSSLSEVGSAAKVVGVWVLAFAAVGVASLMRSNDLPLGMAYLRSMAVPPLAAAAIAMSFGRLRRSSVPMTSIAICGAALAGVLFAQSGGDLFYVSTRAARTSLGATNYLAAFLVISVTISVGLGLGASGTGRRVVGWSCAAAGALGLLLTGSRGGLLALGVAVGVFALLSPVRGRLVLGLAVVSTAFALVGGLSLVGVTAGRFSSAQGLSSAIARTRLWEAAWRAMLDAPLLGVGAGGFRSIAAHLGMSVESPHNVVLSIGVQTGILGVITYFSGMWAALKRAVARMRRGDSVQERVMLAAGVAALVGALVHSMVEPTFEGYQFGFWWWLLAFSVIGGVVPGTMGSRREAGALG